MKKTQKEKMLSGEYYDASDILLQKERISARELLFEYNSLRPGEVEKSELVLKKLLANVGQGVVVEQNFRCDYGYNISLGNDVFLNYDCVLIDVCAIHIGNNVLVGPGVHIYTAMHPLEARIRLAGMEYGRPVSVGNNVWIGGRAIINPGVVIGNNAVVASGAVVTKDVPPNTLVAGIPAKVVKKLTE